MVFGLFESLFTKFEKDLPNVDGKVFAITGTTSGTGYIAAETVAKHGGTVLLLNRPSTRSESSLRKLKESVPDATFVPIDCDLQDFESVRNAAKEIESKYDLLYCLSNNAGIMAVDDEVTKDGYDKQMQTNHLSHFLLTKHLFPLLVKGAEKWGEARLVQHSSIARLETEHNKLEEKYFLKHKDGELGGNEILSGNMKGGPWFRYHQTKLANSVFNHALSDRITSTKNEGAVKNVIATCAHPGVSRTNLADHLSGKYNPFISKIVFPVLSHVAFQSSEDGAMGLLKGMMDSKENIESGVLYGPALKLNPDPKPSMTGPAVANPALCYEIDIESKEMLWKLSQDATGVTFDI